MPSERCVGRRRPEGVGVVEEEVVGGRETSIFGDRDVDENDRLKALANTADCNLLKVFGCILSAVGGRF